MLHSLKNPDVGIFLFRLAAGGLMVFHGVQTLSSGPETWLYLGGTMKHLGIHFGHVFWGLMAAITQAFGGLCFVLGLFFRTACLFLAFTMLMAIIYHFMQGDSIAKDGGQALLYFFTFAAFIFVGPGQLSVCKD